MMTFSPGVLARRLLDRTDEEIIDIYSKDLDIVLPGFGDIIEEAHVQRWQTGAPYSFPGRGKLQPTLMRQGERVFLAGDYLGTLYTESAVQTGFTAASRAAGVLTNERQTRHATLPA